MLRTLVIFAAVMPTVAIAEVEITALPSKVYQAQGTGPEIFARGRTCLAEKIGAGTNDEPTIISNDNENYLIVARTSIEYGTISRSHLRGRLKFEARDGRFRIEQTNLERKFVSTFTGQEGWAPMNSFKRKEALGKFDEMGEGIAQCIMNVAENSNW